MRHNPNNANCDKNVYAGADDIKCTCDIDDPDDVVTPSVIMPKEHAIAPSAPGQVTLRGDHAASYLELQAATRDLEAARAMLKPAEARWRTALDRFHAEMLR